MGHPCALILNIEGARDHSFKKIDNAGFLIFFQYIIDPNQQYSHQHHSLSSAIDTLLLSVSFNPIFIDFAHALNMLAL